MTQTRHPHAEESALDTLLQRYPQLNAPQVSRRALLAAGSLLALDLTGCGSSDDATTGTVVNGGGGGGGGNTAPTLSSFTPSGGLTVGATVVTLNGTNLTGATSVMFGTTAAINVTVVNSTQITATAPAHVMGPVQISVTTPGGTASSSTNYTYGSVVSTFAGSGGTVFNNGSGTAATFNYPASVAVDSNGNVYVADTYNNMIRMITSQGVVSTFAGAGYGNSGTADGTGTAARFQQPAGVAVDSNGNVFVADQVNHTIRMITPARVVTTIAGAGPSNFGTADGTGNTARFHAPTGVAVDSSGNVYVADLLNNSIRMITSQGVVSTLAGSGTATFADGSGTAASFYHPSGVAVDSSGNVYVADTNNNSIRMITSQRVVTTLAGSGTATFADGSGTAASFYHPYGIALDSSGNLYVGDTSNQRVRMITSGGVVTTLAGSGTGTFADGTGTAASFYSPTGLALDSSGNLYVADMSNQRIRKIV